MTPRPRLRSAATFVCRFRKRLAKADRQHWLGSAPGNAGTTHDGTALHSRPAVPAETGLKLSPVHGHLAHLLGTNRTSKDREPGSLTLYATRARQTGRSERSRRPGNSANKRTYTEHTRAVNERGRSLAQRQATKKFPLGPKPIRRRAYDSPLTRLTLSKMSETIALAACAPRIKSPIPPVAPLIWRPANRLRTAEALMRARYSAFALARSIFFWTPSRLNRVMTLTVRRWRIGPRSRSGKDWTSFPPNRARLATSRGLSNLSRISSWMAKRARIASVRCFAWTKPTDAGFRPRRPTVNRRRSSRATSPARNDLAPAVRERNKKCCGAAA